MNNETFLPVLKGLLSKFIGYKKKTPTSTGGTINSRYCYTVWLRHLIYASHSGYKHINTTVAELGPGDSLGTGLAALLCGCRHYYALDIFKYWDIERNLKIFDELVELFKQRANIPGDIEFPRTTPKLDSYGFPSDILPENILQGSLSEERINKIRNELMHLEDEKDNAFISCYVPWDDKTIIEKDTVDLFFSQAALQYVSALENTYEAIKNLLKVGGIMSHSVDFSSHHLTKTWNGHWTFSEKEWELIKQKTPAPLNRASVTDHFKIIGKLNFKMTKIIKYPGPEGFVLKNFASPFKHLSTEACSTRAAFIQAIKQ